LAKKKIFYGWWVLTGCFFFSLYVGGVIVYGFTTIFEPIADEFGWSYAQISFAASLRGLEMSILAPILGILVDRLGPRRLLFAGAIITGIGLLILSRMNSLLMYYVAFVVIAIGMSPSGGTVMVAAVGNWFRKKIALVVGIAASGFALGGILVPFMSNYIGVYGWREVIFGIAMGMWIIGIPLSLLVRHKPEQYGYLPDGEVNNGPSVGGSEPGTADDVEISIKSIIRNSVFWRITMVFFCQLMAVNSAIAHIMPYLSSVGVSREISSLVAGALPIVSIGGRLGFGWIGDRYNKKMLAISGLVLSAIGLLVFIFAARGVYLLVLFLIMFGTGWGGNVTMRAALLREYFGRNKFGTIYGMAVCISMIGVMIGAPLAGWVYDVWQSYTYAWLGFALIVVIAIINLSSVPPAQKVRINSSNMGHE
jgi:MFS family permease